MKIEADAKQVTVWVNSSDRWHRRPLYLAIVERCQALGIAGATVTRCTEGYGAGQQLHSTRLLEMSQNLPLRIDVIDLPERIDPLLAELEGMIGEGLVSIANVRILRFLPDPKA
jgi:PII-like signaling protein